MIIKIDALDTLFFRDGKPFSLGEETWAEGVFPPNPGVLYGALRSMYFAQNPQELHKANQENDPTKDLRINALYFWVDDEPHFVCPLDYVQDKSGHHKDSHLLTLQPIPFSGLAKYPLSHCLVPPVHQQVTHEEGLISLNALEKYLLEHISFGLATPWSTYVQTEPKVGIGRNKHTHSTQEGLLYRVGMVRPAYQLFREDTIAPTKRLSLMVDFEGLPQASELPQSGFLKLGGEGKTIHYQTLDEEIDIPSQVIEGQAIFQLVLLTPTIFEAGWHPKWLKFNNDLRTYVGEIKIDDHTKVSVELLAAAIGKPISIGGFDIQQNLPKPMYKMVPAGSVYYFRLKKPKDAHLVQQKYHLGNISEKRSKEGFGITLFTQNPIQS